MRKELEILENFSEDDMVTINYAKWKKWVDGLKMVERGQEEREKAIKEAQDSGRVLLVRETSVGQYTAQTREYVSGDEAMKIIIAQKDSDIRSYAYRVVMRLSRIAYNTKRGKLKKELDEFINELREQA